MSQHDPVDALSPEAILDLFDVAQPRPRVRVSRHRPSPIHRQPITQRLDDLSQMAAWIQDMCVALKREYLAVDAELHRMGL